MPDYDYLCERCGPFTENRPMAMFNAPHPCPGCGADAPRALLRGPALGRMEASQRKAFATNEQSAHAPKLASSAGRHPRGCGCCSAGTGRKAEAVSPAKGFPGKRPWMISH
ncbi:Zinc ribbon domain-containing protein [Rhodovastum atsumiense]|uniref:Zinc ribbon domain-containing protein n=1 Tax=Rhodovastum atsumiense TaxID=504468 RepID=A0A5M6IXN7_9PROT|nr:FmdB family zinc ribbon protein [Rhodovastum atsumiense]KAA5612597.1 zinc ribbon domain-containing protein [Rhodovastum atsumiense]CAH2601305.1 Zinc ribbon domain-containing protein [Rhodovastum atsumiense]